ncbi:MAG: single-stranded DNA-binding protein [Candidatus Margulisiibacteriota bacterium]
MLNQCSLIGRLGADPEVRYTQDGLMITSFRIATSEKFKDKEYTEWHKIITFKKLAEICGNYLKKGSLVYIAGRIQTRSWDDKEGVKRYTTEIMANTMKMLDGRKAEEKDSYEVDDNIPF